MGTPLIDGIRAESLCEIHKITSDPYHHTHAYPTARAWHRDNKKIFVDHNGPGPDGEVKKNVRHLMTLDIETGERRYIARNEHPDPDKHAADFMFDYAPMVNMLVYADAECKHIYTHNLDLGVVKEIYHEQDGILGGPLSIAHDGTRVTWWSMIESKESRWFDDYITVIFCTDVDPISNRHKFEPRIVEAWPRRKLPAWTERHSPGIHINHCQINPRDRDHICYAHETRGRAGSVEKTWALCRLWNARADGGHNRCLTPQDATHEVIAPDGKSIIFPYHQGVGEVVFETGEAKAIYYNPRCCPGHLNISPDGKWICGDTWNLWTDEEGTVYQSVMMFEKETRRCAHLCWFPYSHPHPIFSNDGTKIAFSYFDSDQNQQLAWIDVTDVQANWEDVYQDTGELVGPGWTGNKEP